MCILKSTLVKERGEGGELKRNHEVTLSEFKMIQNDYQDLELEKDSLVLLDTIIDGEKKEFENKISELEAWKSATDRQAEEIRTQVGELEAQNSSLETQLKTTNE